MYFLSISALGGSQDGVSPPGVMKLHDYGYLPPEVFKSYPVSE